MPHTCECGSTDGFSFMVSDNRGDRTPLMSWCARCGKAYDPLNDMKRFPGEDLSPEEAQKRYLESRGGA